MPLGSSQCGFATSSAWSSSNSESMNGPFPTRFSGFRHSSPSSWHLCFGQGNAHAEARMYGKKLRGSRRRTSSVRSSSATANSTSSIMNAVRVFSSRMLFHANAKSSAVSGSPSLHLHPSRRRKR